MLEKQIGTLLGDAMAKHLDSEVKYGLDEECLKWHKNRMLTEIANLKPFPRSKRALLKAISK